MAFHFKSAVRFLHRIVLCFNNFSVLGGGKIRSLIFCSFRVQCLIKIKQFLDKVFLLNKMKSLIEKLREESKQNERNFLLKVILSLIDYHKKIHIFLCVYFYVLQDSNAAMAIYMD